MPIDHAKVLLGMIDEFLSGELDFDTFNSRYYFYFVDDMPEQALRDEQYDFFARVHEKLDWTSKTPDDESRTYGWSDANEFREWLRAERDRFQHQ